MDATPQAFPFQDKPAKSYQPDPNEVTVFAETNFRNQRRRFGIKLDDRRRHMYVMGKTGMGKSTMLENMIISDIQRGNGLAVVDPHGDLVEKVVNFIPEERIKDVIYFNPSDTEYPIAFNILEAVNPEHKNLIASGLVGVFKKIWADSWGPRLEYILTNAILALMDYEGSTLLGVTRILVDKKYRKTVVEKIKDPVVRSFWVDEYANYSEKFRSEAIAPIQNKVGQFLSTHIIRNIVGQPKSTLDMRKIMDNGNILLMNLSKGRIGEENSALLGAMMITKLQLAAMSRVDIPETERRDFYLYVDEFQNFATDSFANILSEARKYRLNLIMAHQYVEQLGDLVKAAVFGNVGTMILFRIGAVDAAEFEEEFGPTFTPNDLVNIDKHNIYLKLMINGIASDPFSAVTLPPVEGETRHRDAVAESSRRQYSNSRSKVERDIMVWAGMAPEAAATGIPAAAREEPEEVPEKIPVISPRQFKERLKSLGEEAQIVPEAPTPLAGAAPAPALSLADALKTGKTVTFSGKPPAPPSAKPMPAKPVAPPSMAVRVPVVSAVSARPATTPPPQAKGIRLPGAPTPMPPPARPVPSAPAMPGALPPSRPGMPQPVPGEGKRKRRRRRRGKQPGAMVGPAGLPPQPPVIPKPAPPTPTVTPPRIPTPQPVNRGPSKPVTPLPPTPTRPSGVAPSFIKSPPASA